MCISDSLFDGGLAESEVCSTRTGVLSHTGPVCVRKTLKVLY